MSQTLVQLDRGSITLVQLDRGSIVSGNHFRKADKTSGKMKITRQGEKYNCSGLNVLTDHSPV